MALVAHLPALALVIHFSVLGIGYISVFPRLVLAGYFSGLGGSCMFTTLAFVFISSAWLVELLRLPGFVLRQTKKGEAAEMFLSNLRNCASCLLEKAPQSIRRLHEISVAEDRKNMKKQRPKVIASHPNNKQQFFITRLFLIEYRPKASFFDALQFPPVTFSTGYMR